MLIKLAGLHSFLFLMMVNLEVAVTREPIPLPAGPHLFIYLIQTSEDLTRTTHPPEKKPESIIKKSEPCHQ